MKARLVLAPLVAGALAFSAAGAQAATPILDGKRVKTLSWTATSTAQVNDADFAALDGPARVDCAPPRCAKFLFVYKPAKGVKAQGLAFQASWTTPVADIDLYVAEKNKDGSFSEMGNCGTFAGASEKIYLPTTDFKAGRTYAVIVDFYRTATETVTARVDFPGTSSMGTTVPAEIDDLQSTNCGQ